MTEYRTIQLCRHDYARLKCIGHETICHWLGKARGYPCAVDNDTKAVYDYWDPRGDKWNDRDLFFVVVKRESASDYEFQKGEVVRLWAIWSPGDMAENVEQVLDELEKLQKGKQMSDKSSKKWRINGTAVVELIQQDIEAETEEEAIAAFKAHLDNSHLDTESIEISECRELEWWEG